VTSVLLPNESALPGDGLRPINLKTDLGQLADLIELVFADSIDQGGMNAAREMRTMNRLGIGLSILAGLNDLAQGISLGYVWIAGGKLVGNVSIYPANWPGTAGRVWVIANVGVHPDYQGRGIATELMRASLNSIAQRDASAAVLQVESRNEGAWRIYQRLGFVEERTWTIWKRLSSSRVGTGSDDHSVYIAWRRPEEWRLEYELAQRVRPANQGGVGWQRPLHPSLFRKPFLKRLDDWFSLRSQERLVIRSEDQTRLLASMWVESGALTSSTQLTLMVEPEYQGYYDDVLLQLAIRRFGDGRHALMIEHPSDQKVTSELLRKYYFRPQREVVHMRYDFPRRR
jgi:ribosomal protein S18 acetylase RimI-like enzyme